MRCAPSAAWPFADSLPGTTLRRADRLYRITDYLRGRRLTTAEWLASRLGVSPRTVYRDIADLVAAGVPVHGEAGMGYALARRVDLPPLMFDREELQALALGLRFVVAEGDPAVRQAAERALAKLRATLPREQSLRLAESPVYVPRRRPETAARLAELVAAVEARDVLRLTYADERGATTVRNVRPLGALYGVAAWSLVAWCELREAHRTFRLDRIHGVTKTGRRFHPEVGRGLQDFFQALQADYGIPTAHFDPEG